MSTVVRVDGLHRRSLVKTGERFYLQTLLSDTLLDIPIDTQTMSV